MRRYNREERRLWVLNDESLYCWQRHSHMTMTQFLKQYAVQIDQHINCQLGLPAEAESENEVTR